MINAIWSSRSADLVFLFNSPFEHDELNRHEVLRGYAALAEEHSGITVIVPPGDQETTTDFLIDHLRHRDLLRN